MDDGAGERGAGGRLGAGDAAIGAAAAGWISIGTTSFAAEGQFHALVDRLIRDDVAAAARARRAYEEAHPRPGAGELREWLAGRREAVREAVVDHVVKEGLLPEPTGFRTLGLAFKALPLGSKVAVGAVVLGTGLGAASLARWWRGRAARGGDEAARGA